MVSIATTVWWLEARCYFTYSQYIKFDGVQSNLAQIWSERNWR